MQHALHTRTADPLNACAVGTHSWDFSVENRLKAQSVGTSFAGDQKSFDAHQHWAIAQHVVGAINALYPKVEKLKGFPESYDWKRMRALYIYSCYTSVCQSKRTVYRMPQGMPSGVCITSHFNSWYLETCTLYCITQQLLRHLETGKITKSDWVFRVLSRLRMLSATCCTLPIMATTPSSSPLTPGRFVPLSSSPTMPPLGSSPLTVSRTSL